MSFPLFLRPRISRLILGISLSVLLAPLLSAQTVYTVNNNANTSEVGTLKWALAQAYNDPGSVISIQSGLKITLDEPLQIWNAVTIIGNGATISGDGKHRIFYIFAPTAETQVNLIGLSLVDGYAKGGDGGYGGGGGGLGAGGAIFVDRGKVTIQSVTFSKNSAVGGNGGNSGATGEGGGGGGLGGNGGDGGRGTYGNTEYMWAGGGGGFLGNGGSGGKDNRPGTAQRAAGNWGGGGGFRGNGAHGGMLTDFLTGGGGGKQFENGSTRADQWIGRNGLGREGGDGAMDVAGKGGDYGGGGGSSGKGGDGGLFELPVEALNMYPIIPTEIVDRLINVGK